MVTQFISPQTFSPAVKSDPRKEDKMKKERNKATHKFKFICQPSLYIENHLTITIASAKASHIRIQHNQY